MSDQPREELWEQEEPLPPRRPRRRLLTPLTALLFAALLGAVGFIVGVEVEKGQTTATAGTRTGGRLAALSLGAGAAPASRGVGGGGGSGATVGQVAYISGKDVYVTDLQGNTVKVQVSSAQITRQVNSSVKGVHPGDTVIVQGATHANGSVLASSVRDSGSAGAALFGSSSSSSSGAGASASGPPAEGPPGAGGGGPALFGK
jgi:hypothetical protein